MKSITFILSYAVAVLIVFSVYTNHSNEALERTVHAQYTEKLTNASEKLTYLQRAVSQSLLFKDQQAFTTELDNIWRLSSDIRTSLASLPLDRDVSNKWMTYLGKIGNEAKRTAVTQDVESWQKKMINVSHNLQQLSDAWAVATTIYYEQDGNFKKWQAETAKEQTANRFSGVSKALKTYNESDFPLTTSESDWKKKQELKELNDQDISKKEAITKLGKYIPSLKNATIAVSDSKKDAPYPFYHLQFHEDIRLGYADITVKGGHLLSFLMERPIDDAKISQQQVLEKAKQIVKNIGFEDVQYVESRENHQVWHVTFARVHPQNKALIYADAVQLKLAKDNGELLGVNAMEYIQKEQLKPQEIKPIDWKKFFSKDTVIEKQRLIYTDNGQFEQRLCYEVLAVRDGKQLETFRIVIDTENHQVLKVEYLS